MEEILPLTEREGKRHLQLGRMITSRSLNSKPRTLINFKISEKEDTSWTFFWMLWKVLLFQFIVQAYHNSKTSIIGRINKSLIFKQDTVED